MRRMTVNLMFWCCLISGFGVRGFRSPEDQVVIVGGQIRMNCSNSTTIVSWRGPNGLLITQAQFVSDDRFNLDLTNGFDLVASNVNASLCGTYTCENLVLGFGASANIAVLDRLPLCRGIGNDSYAEVTCSVSFCGNTSSLSLKLEYENGQSLSSTVGNSTFVSWSGYYNKNISCSAAPGLKSSCNIDSGFCMITIYVVQVIIAISSALIAVAIAGILIAVLFMCEAETKTSVDIWAAVFNWIFFLLSLGIMIPSAVATANFAGSSVKAALTSTNETEAYLANQNESWLIGVLVISAFFTCMELILSIIATISCVKDSGKNNVTSITLLVVSVLLFLGSSTILAWSVTVGSKFLQLSSCLLTFWTWQIFLIVFLVSLAIALTLSLIAMKYGCPNRGFCRRLCRRSSRRSSRRTSRDGQEIPSSNNLTSGSLTTGTPIGTARRQLPPIVSPKNSPSPRPLPPLTTNDSHRNRQA